MDGRAACTVHPVVDSCPWNQGKQREADVWGRTSVADKLDHAFAVGDGRCVSVMPLCRRQFLAGISKVGSNLDFN
jgi:hypothetical protein